MFFWKCIIYFIRFVFSHNKQTREMEHVVYWWLRCIPCNCICWMSAGDLRMSLLYFFSSHQYRLKYKHWYWNLSLNTSQMLFFTHSHTQIDGHTHTLPSCGIYCTPHNSSTVKRWSVLHPLHIFHRREHHSDRKSQLLTTTSPVILF